jgi:hypothetical protein
MKVLADTISNYKSEHMQKLFFIAACGFIGMVVCATPALADDAAPHHHIITGGPDVRTIIVPKEYKKGNLHTGDQHVVKKKNSVAKSKHALAPTQTDSSIGEVGGLGQVDGNGIGGIGVTP